MGQHEDDGAGNRNSRPAEPHLYHDGGRNGGQNRTATVDGKVEENGTIIANINGPNVTCKSVTIRTYRFQTDGN